MRTHSVCDRERDLSAQNPPNSIGAQARQTNFKKTRFFCKNTKISVMDTIGPAGGSALRGSIVRYGYDLSTFYTAKKGPEERQPVRRQFPLATTKACLLYTSDAADE